jgi:HSP20 family protein
MSYPTAELRVTSRWRSGGPLCDHAAMRSRIHAVVLPSELGDFADEVRRVFLELGRTGGSGSLAGECSPPIDVFETDEAVEVAVDLPGVDPAAVRILVKGDAVLIIGEKAARRGRSESTFHLVERGFGRFARAVRLDRACDATHARATLDHGELRISISKIADRRGRAMAIPITS